MNIFNFFKKSPKIFSEKWCEYDPQNNLIHYKDSEGFEFWQEFNKNRELIHKRSVFKEFGTFEEWYEYDSQNKIIHYKNTNREEYWLEYDSNGNIIYRKEVRR